MKQSGDRSVVETGETLDWLNDLKPNLEPRPENHGVTRREYADRFNVAETTAKFRLEKLVSEGVMERKQYKVGNKTTWVYWKK